MELLKNVRAHTLTAPPPQKKPTCTSLTHQIHSQVSYYTSAGISQKPGCLSALSRSANAAAGFAMGAEDQSHEMRE